MNDLIQNKDIWYFIDALVIEYNKNTQASVTIRTEHIQFVR